MLSISTLFTEKTKITIYFESVQREQEKSIGHLKLKLLWIIILVKPPFIYLKMIGL